MQAASYRHGKGFSLIELLVVIAIISIMAAIIFPIFLKSREKARQATCQSNLRQIGIALTQYTQDYNEKFVSGRTGKVPFSGWAGQVYPYLKSTGVFHCPDDPTSADGAAVPVSYGINHNIVDPDLDPDGLAGLRAPASTVLCFEVNNVVAGITTNPEKPGSTRQYSPTGNGMTFPMNGSGVFDVDAGYASHLALFATGKMGNKANLTTNPFDPYRTSIQPYHNGGANYLAADGHVKWLQPIAVSAGLSSSDPKVSQDPDMQGTAAGVSNMGSFTLTFNL